MGAPTLQPINLPFSDVVKCINAVLECCMYECIGRPIRISYMSRDTNLQNPLLVGIARIIEKSLIVHQIKDINAD